MEQSRVDVVLLDLTLHQQDVQIGRLRRKLNDDPQRPQLIKTLRGAGDMFAAAVEVVTVNASGSSATYELC
jgi:DNA-binding winged helix-turn-helix (wHTH) protein